MPMTDVAIDPPTATAKQLVLRILGYGVWVGIALAPWLGKLKVRLFSALIELYPESLQDWLIPVSAALVGMIVVVIDFATNERTSKAAIRRWFIATVIVFVSTLLTLVWIYPDLVARVEKGLEGDRMAYLAVVTGTPEVPGPLPAKCKCTPGDPAEQCVGDVGLKPANVRTCFGAVRINRATRALTLLYLAVMASFAGAVGLGGLQWKNRSM